MLPTQRLGSHRYLPSFALAVATELALAAVQAEPPSAEAQQTLAQVLVAPEERSRSALEAAQRPAVEPTTAAEFRCQPAEAASCHLVGVVAPCHPEGPAAQAALASAHFAPMAAKPSEA